MNQKLIIIPSLNFILSPVKASILHSSNDQTLDYFWKQIEFSNLFVKIMPIFELLSFVILMELEIVI